MVVTIEEAIARRERIVHNGIDFDTPVLVVTARDGRATLRVDGRSVSVCEGEELHIKFCAIGREP